MKGRAAAKSKAKQQQDDEMDGKMTAKEESCLETVAKLSGEKDVGEYARACDIFERLGKAAMDSNLKKFSARKHFMSCVMCHLARPDVVGARMAVNSAKETDYTFAASREGELSEVWET